MWHKGNTIPMQISTGNWSEYTNLLVAINGDIYFENGSEKGRIDKWSRKSSNSEVVTTFPDHCYGLFVDIQNALYCSMRLAHQVVKILLDNDTITMITVAGTGSPGLASSQLRQPWGIFVDQQFALFVTDHGNGRIRRFQSGQLSGATVAGRGTPNGLQLKGPTDVTLDADGLLYIADNQNDRVIRATPDEYTCIAGCNSRSGSAANELYRPYALRFDGVGNFYVADEFNQRIQKFSLSDNSCGKY